MQKPIVERRCAAAPWPLVWVATLFLITLSLVNAQGTVQDLGKDTFKAAIQDPAQPLWLLKFYAPWCGHCKRLAPVLDKVALQTASPNAKDSMSIGKIDCTKEQVLCNEHGVRAYPTMKISVLGEIYDYDGGRTERDFLAFAQKMNRPALSVLPSVQAVYEVAAQEAAEDSTGVVFVAYDPALKNAHSKVSEHGSMLTRVFEQVARKSQASATFLVLSKNTPDLSNHPSLLEAANSDKKEPFVCRLEPGVTPRCFSSQQKENDSPFQTTSIQDEMLDFVRLNNVATVSALGPHNFHKVSRHDGGSKPLIIGVVKDGASTSTASDVDASPAAMRKVLLDYATTGEHGDEYLYGTLDGTTWQKFLNQFDVTPDEVPQIFCLQVAPSKLYWQNATYGMRIADFVADMKAGVLPKQRPGQNKGGLSGIGAKLFWAIKENRPWSIILIVLLFLAIAVFLGTVLEPPPRPPYDWDKDAPPSKKAAAKKATPAAAAAPAATETATATDETKKDR